MTEKISSPEACKNLVRKILENHKLPYITITPTFSICPNHGYLAGEFDFCPRCDEENEVKDNRYDNEFRATYKEVLISRS